METLTRMFQSGGWMMYPIFILGLSLVYVSVDRFYYLFVKNRLHKEVFFKTVQQNLLKTDFDSILKTCDQHPTAMTRIIKACLIRVINHGTDHEIQSTLDEGAMMEVPNIEKRIGFLSVIGNTATLLGLLGTISGLITSFESVSNSDPATKAQELTRGISEAMNCTAFGLLVAIPSIFLYYFFQSRAQKIIDEINEISIRTFNFILANRDRLGLS